MTGQFVPILKGMKSVVDMCDSVNDSSCIIHRCGIRHHDLGVLLGHLLLHHHRLDPVLPARHHLLHPRPALGIMR